MAHHPIDPARRDQILRNIKARLKDCVDSIMRDDVDKALREGSHHAWPQHAWSHHDEEPWPKPETLESALRDMLSSWNSTIGYVGVWIDSVEGGGSKVILHPFGQGEPEFEVVGNTVSRVDGKTR